MPASTPKLALPYPLPTDQVSEGANDMQALAERVETTLAPAYDNALPVAPYIGQRLSFQTGATGVFWELVWFGDSWYFLGGPPMVAVDAGELGVANAWAASTPSLPVPLTGVYDVGVAFKIDGNSHGPDNKAMACAMVGQQGGAGMVDANALWLQSGHGYGGWTPFVASGSLELRFGTLYRTSGNIAAAYRNNGPSSAWPTDRRLWIRPVYIAPAAAQLLDPPAYELWLAKQPELETPIAEPPTLETKPA